MCDNKKEIIETNEEHIVNIKQKCYHYIKKIKHFQENPSKKNKLKISYCLRQIKKLLKSMNNTKDVLHEIETHHLFDILH